MNGPTRSEQVFQLIRRDILDGILEPGSRLGFAELGKNYSASVGVLREVLPRLVERGLATSESQLGFRVITVSVRDLLNLTELRVMVEGEALRQSIAHGDLEWAASVVSRLHLLNNTPPNGEHGINPDWLAAHGAFHAALLAGGTNTRLTGMAEVLRDSAEVYQCWSRQGYESRRINFAAEHGELSELTIARNTDLAVERLSEHIWQTTRLLIDDVGESA